MFGLKTTPVNVHPLFSAIIHKTPDEVEQMIDSGSNVNMRTTDGGKTPLHVACHRGNLQMVILLLRKKADVTAMTDAGFTPLHVAAQNGYSKIIVELVAARAPINATTTVGCTPLHESAANGHEEATLKLLELKAESNLKDFRYNLTAANLAHEKGHTKIRDILCAKLSFQDSFIQNVNFILFNWGRFFPISTEAGKFIQQLATDIKDLKNADEVFKIIQHALKSPAYNLVEESLKPVRQLLIQNMKKYNEDKIAALKKTAEVANLAPNTTAGNIKAASPPNAAPNTQNEDHQKRFSKKKS